MVKLKLGPYSFKEGIKWLLYYFMPSMKKSVSFEQLSYFYGEKEMNDLQISFLGDLMCLNNEAMAKPCAELKEAIRNSDLVVINLEAPLTRNKIEKNQSLLVFSFSEEFIEKFLETYELSREKVIFSIANNHIGDQGREGLIETVKRLNKLKIKFVGTTDHLQTMPVLELKNQRIGFLSYTEWLNRDVFDSAVGVLRRNDIEKLDIKERKEKEKLDTLIFLNHWCYEFRHYPSLDFVNFAKRMINEGVDIIAGHHPHVLGPIQKIGEGICHYSLGNFFAKTIHWSTKITGVWNVGLKEGKFNSYEFHPFYMTKENEEYKIVSIDQLETTLKNKVVERLDNLYPNNEY